jgi:S1-C subfamily serine protease
VVGRFQVPWGGDIITHVDRIPVTSLEALAKQIETRKPGTTVVLRVIREERVREITVTLKARPRR